MLIPSIDDKEVGGLNGEVADLADMSRIGVGSGLHIIGLKITEIDTLVVEDTIEPIFGKHLIDSVHGHGEFCLSAVEGIGGDAAHRVLFQVGARGEREERGERKEERECCYQRLRISDSYVRIHNY